MRFLTAASLPPAPYDHGELPLDGVDWAVTSEFSHMAKNHCAAVCATNLILWLTARTPSPAAPTADSPSKEQLFRAVHAMIGNGPVAAIAGKVRRYLSQRGSRPRSRLLWGAPALLAALREGCPCALLLAGGPLDWHWVLAVGWRGYPSGDVYLRILDGWHPTADRFLPLRGRPWLVSARAYRLDP